MQLDLTFRQENNGVRVACVVKVKTSLPESLCITQTDILGVLARLLDEIDVFGLQL